jgi:hypothetical protein
MELEVFMPAKRQDDPQREALDDFKPVVQRPLTTAVGIGLCLTIVAAIVVLIVLFSQIHAFNGKSLMTGFLT